MAIRVNFAGASLTKPGSYSNLTVGQAGVAIPAVGTVAIIGEADGGIPFSEEAGLSKVSFGPDEKSAVKEKFVDGPLVDAYNLVIQASKDRQITGGAQEVLLLKTNRSTRASLNVMKDSMTVYATLTDKVGGAKGNNIYYACENNGTTATITVTSADGVGKPKTIGNTPVMKITGPGMSSLTITDTAFTVSGASAFSIPFSEAPTIAALVEKINTKTGFGATAADKMSSKLVDRLDRVSNVSLSSSEFTVKQDAWEFRDLFSVEFPKIQVSQSVKSGLPPTATKKNFEGGAKGGTLSSDVQNCLDELLKRRVNFVVPLFSRDSMLDASEGATDPSSSYSIDAIHAATTSHVMLASTTKGRKERQAWVGYKGTFDDSAAKAGAIGNHRVSMCIQDVQIGSTIHQPHMLAVAAAGMHAAAAIGLSTTFKSVNILGFAHQDFDPETQAEKAIEANLTFVETSPSGAPRFVLDNNTYGADADAWIYNRPSVIYAGDFASYLIRLSTEQFVGQRNSDVSPESIKNLLVTVFDSLRSLGVIVADALTGGKGYKDLSVKINGSIVSVDVTLALVENYEFILNDIKVQRAG